VSIVLGNKGLALVMMLCSLPMAFVCGYRYRADVIRGRTPWRFLQVAGDFDDVDDDPISKRS
jgi:hypothetical protein